MNKSENFIKLPLIETLKNSFAYVWYNKKILWNSLPIVAALIVLQLILSTTSSCNPDIDDCDTTWQNLTVSFGFLILNIGIIINYCREIVLKEDINFVSIGFWKNTLFYFLASLGIGIALVLPILFLVAIYATSGNFIPHLNSLILLIYAFILVELILVAPLFLIFPSIAVNDYEMLSIKKLFRLGKRNHNRIFWGLIASSIPCFLFLLVSATILFAVYDVETVRNSFSFGLLGLFMQLINTAFNASYYAHIYQFFKFVEKKEKN